MSQKVDRVGRIAAVVSSIVLVALLFNLWVLSATAVEPVAAAPENHYTLEEKSSVGWFQYIYDAVVPTVSATDAVSAFDMKDELGTIRHGKPVAYVNIDKLYLITKTGKIIGPADSCKYVDVPIISSDSFLVDAEGKRLVDDGTKNALRFLSEIQRNYAVKSLLSEIKIKNDNIIAYMNLGDVMPVIFGQGNWEQKINALVSYQKQLGASDLTRQALYLDLRIEDRIIVKKNV